MSDNSGRLAFATEREPAVQLQRDIRALARSLRWRRRLRITVRALWFGLCVAVIGLGLRLLGLDLRWPLFVFPAAFVTASMLIADWWSNPSLPRLAQSYDRHFQLHELLATGLEVARRTNEPGAGTGPVEQGLIEQSLLAIYALRRRVRARPLIPLRDIEMLLAVSLIAVGLLIVDRWTSLPDVTPLAIQPLPSPVAAEVPTPTPPAAADEPVANPEPPEPDQLSPEDQEAADAIADALRDSGPTRPAADALDRGAPGEAASDLRELADQADQLSEEARGDLADDLRDAAGELESSQPRRADRLDQQADALEAGPEDAAEALEDLAGLLDELGQNSQAAASAGDEQQGADDAQGGETPGEAGEGAGAPGNQAGPGSGDGLGGESRGGETAPPTAGGEAVPLPPSLDQGGERTSATGPQGPSVELEAGGTRAPEAAGAQAPTGSDSELSGEADPLRIPPEYRDVVEKYFSPSR